ncbi:cellulose synthase complex periplasmic endoglucanase BcsZ [Dryocola clanedunensis]|uniref:cellulose synthase complex periplasmic endoglucanase BcsZ n=1 Tax=Cedecea sulfonylureivorans TaxID=3051154 RepID=UPI001926012F|nr:cellulose synthase complex periplasmic endoglucanase BcsZ [Cedecea sulfonylureivorans]
MKLRMGMLMTGLLFVSITGQAACHWPAWQGFKKAYISDEGRVIDPSNERKITTSEGQSYGMFFALAANDKEAFAQLLRWTENNLAQGSLKDHLPAWEWGRKDDNTWTVLDSNSASDADMWIVWSLLEAGRLWDKPSYTRLGQRLLKRVAKEEVAKVPGLGNMLLPGKYGFNHAPEWRFNPSYLPPQVLSRVTRYKGPWKSMVKTNQRLLLETSPKGFAPDWVNWVEGKGWQMKPEEPLVGSYDAIRVYLWAGMMADNDPHKAELLKRWQPMAQMTAKSGLPPEHVTVVTSERKGDGPVGFSASLLPFLQGDKAALDVQRQRVVANQPQTDAYYNYVLTLFGQGWDQKHFRFNAQGELLPNWGKACVNSQ